jgi:hypothetical protein
VDHDSKMPVLSRNRMEGIGRKFEYMYLRCFYKVSEGRYVHCYGCISIPV